MAIKVKATMGDFGGRVTELLGEYQLGLYSKLEPTMRKTANEIRKELRATSPKGPTKKYSRGWEYELKVNSRIGGGELKLYNAIPGLTHLLENGHAVRNGTGRNSGKQFAAARPHIEAANEKAQQLMLDNLKLALGEFDW